MSLEILNFVLEKKSQNNPLISRAADFPNIYQIAKNTLSHDIIGKGEILQENQPGYGEYISQVRSGLNPGLQ
ncbi:MAG: hypothetical protein KAU23_02250 [Anaerolineales bacterium]|nr:hypothetical protein [Anaerolineales bacterium]